MSLLAPLASTAFAEESAPGSSIDLSVLANIASSIGSNPQILNMVSSLMSQGIAGADGAQPSASSTDATGPNVAQPSELGSNEGFPASEDPLSPDIPLRRGARQPGAEMPTEGAGQNLNSMHNQRSQPPQRQPAISRSLSSLVALLPNVLPNLNLNGLLSSLIRPLPQHAASAPTSAVTDQQPQQGIPQQQNNGGPNFSSAPAQANRYQAQGPSAQSVINQVLTAYASGQIPTELIQLGLSGRVPSQVIELALSGQVPSQMIQMIITGQVPMSTINSVLAAMQPQGDSRRGLEPQHYSHHPRLPHFSVIGTTRALFEDLFRGSTLGPSGSGLPTSLGPIPLSIPKFPTARRIGQLLGGTISNMASMIAS